MAGPPLGKGAYGYVLGCVNRITKKRYACKTIDVKSLLLTRDGPNILGRLRNEITIMSYLAGHPNIVQLVDVFETSENIFMVQASLLKGGGDGRNERRPSKKAPRRRFCNWALGRLTAAHTGLSSSRPSTLSRGRTTWGQNGGAPSQQNVPCACMRSEVCVVVAAVAFRRLTDPPPLPPIPVAHNACVR